MAWKQKVTGGVLAFVGYMLSPLSWWNDMFVNVPLALAFAWVVSLFWKSVFAPSLVLGYWLTNILGFILLHKGAEKMFSSKPGRYTRRDLLRDVGESESAPCRVHAVVRSSRSSPDSSDQVSRDNPGSQG